uniref:hypothetical protein n=1 Tax=Trichocoleus desertorum TaxID=1481672 RepID=UPI0025B3492B|nr:hypothetical protein [Trichocoleus desertorum]
MINCLGTGLGLTHRTTETQREPQGIYVSLALKHEAPAKESVKTPSWQQQLLTAVL